jgi:hypothetical protein
MKTQNCLGIYMMRRFGGLQPVGLQGSHDASNMPLTNFFAQSLIYS